MGADLYQRRIMSLPNHVRLKYQLKAWRLTDVGATDVAIFEPLLAFVFEYKDSEVAMILLRTNKLLNGMITRFLEHFVSNQHTPPPIYPFEQTCTKPHRPLPLLPKRGGFCAVFGACACCGSTKNGNTLTLCYNTFTNAEFAAPLCRRCNSCEWLTELENKYTVAIPDACVCAYRNIHYAIKHTTFKAEYISEQVFQHSGTMAIKRFTQFALCRFDRKMVVALESCDFERCVGPAACTYDQREILDIHTILTRGVNITMKRQSLRLPGSVFYSFVNCHNDGFCQRLKRGCYHCYKIDPEPKSAKGHWRLVECKPCWQGMKWCACRAVGAVGAVD